MRKRQARGQGKLSDQFRLMLEKSLGEGWKVTEIYPATGHNLKCDCYRIEGWAISPEGKKFSFGAYETMTHIVRCGIKTVFDEPLYGSFEVWAADLC